MGNTDNKVKGKIILENGIELEGFSFGAEKNISGEVVFNTGMVGYPESLTDPSYKGQILVLTYPLVGNYGVPEKKFKEFGDSKLLINFESDKIQVRALLVSDYSYDYSHWSASKSLGAWLKEEGIPALYGIDTRYLTKVLREKGVMLGKIEILEEEEKKKNIFEKITQLGKKDYYNPNDVEIVKEVSVKEPINYNDSGKNKKVVLVDCGAKNNIVNELVKRDIAVVRVPYDYDFTSMEFDGVMISNGPGDPKQCKKTVENVKKLLEGEKPVFGICLGNQILALAAGGDTYKLKYGHRSQNQPCVVKGDEKCFITTQNHGFAVNMKSLSGDWEEYFVNANDGTNEGIRHKTKPFFSTQFHVEHCPGPKDTAFILDDFVKLL
tara:strand:+ start:6378 stop:7517 length:1140 start_codon:yes stop_codon:yes gene_type:complete